MYRVFLSVIGYHKGRIFIRSQQCIFLWTHGGYPYKVMPNTVMTRLSTALNWIHGYSLNSSILKPYCDGKETSQSFQIKNLLWTLWNMNWDVSCRSWTVNGSLNWALKYIVWWKIWINCPHSSYFSLSNHVNIVPIQHFLHFGEVVKSPNSSQTMNWIDTVRDNFISLINHSYKRKPKK